MQKGALLVLFEDLIESFDNKEAEATVAHNACHRFWVGGSVQHMWIMSLEELQCQKQPGLLGLLSPPAPQSGMCILPTQEGR